MLRLAMITRLLAIAVVSAGCTNVASVTNLSDSACAPSFESGLSSILIDQKEKPEVAKALAHQTYRVLTSAQLGPRPFLVASPSGTDYTFFVQRKHERCLLRLYGRQKGFMSYTNNLTYIATREIPSCACSE